MFWIGSAVLVFRVGSSSGFEAETRKRSSGIVSKASGSLGSLFLANGEGCVGGGGGVFQDSWPVPGPNFQHLPAIMSQVGLSLSATSPPNNYRVRGLGIFAARPVTSGFQADRLSGRSVVATTAAAAIYAQLLL